MKKEEILAKFDTLNDEEKKAFLASLIDSTNQEIEHLQGMVDYYKSCIFGKKSEKSIVDSGQLSLFDELEVEETVANLEEKTLEVKSYTRKAKGKKNLLNEDHNFEVEIVDHKLEDLTCPKCHELLKEIGYDVRKELCVVPAKYYVKEHRYYKYVCTNCSNMEQVEREIVPFPSSMYSASLVSKIINDKYAMSIPFYRQEQAFNDLGINITRSNMVNYLSKTYDLIKPLYDKYAELIKEVDILNCDETRLKVISQKSENNNVKTNYVWLYRTSKYNDKKILYYYFNEGRKYSNVVDFFNNTTSNKRYVHADGYAAYEHINGYTLVSCFAHARRKFTDTVKKIQSNDENSKSNKLKICNNYIKLIGKLYQFEKIYNERKIFIKERKEKRLIDQKPILDVFFSELKKDSLKVRPTSDLGLAINYCLKREKSLQTYLEDGRLELDNNMAEHMAKNFAVGRKNWLFCENPNGAEKTCAMYTIVETAIANGLKPEAYINWLLENISTTVTSEIENLAPWSDKIPSNLKRQ